MEWIATIKDSGANNGTLYVTVTYSKGSEHFDENITSNFVPSDNWINDSIYNRLQVLNGMDTFLETVPIGKITLSAPNKV